MQLRLTRPTDLTKKWLASDTGQRISPAAVSRAMSMIVVRTCSRHSFISLIFVYELPAPELLFTKPRRSTATSSRRENVDGLSRYLSCPKQSPHGRYQFTLGCLDWLETWLARQLPHSMLRPFCSLLASSCPFSSPLNLNSPRRR